MARFRMGYFCCFALFNLLFVSLFFTKFLTFLFSIYSEGLETPQMIESSYRDIETAFLPPKLTPCYQTDPKCLSLLSKAERDTYESCTRGVRKSLQKLRPVKDGDCRFVSSSSSSSSNVRRGPVALASFPGSGNTWLRGLLELATGVCTGSVYCHAHFRIRGFNGEGVHSGSTLVVKTHEYTYSSQFVSTVFIIRNPYHAIIAGRTTDLLEISNDTDPNDSHLKVLRNKQKYFGYNNKDWDDYLNYHIKWWSKLIRYWVVGSSVPVLVVKFEDLKQDPVQEVKRILDFINYQQLTVEELSLKMKDGFNAFHRNKTVPDDINRLYTKQQIHIVNEHIKKAEAAIKRSKTGQNISIVSYLQKL
ncbi:PREDICTED: WSCD family member GA21586-like [Amphimedon queenslandica]|uniref:Sulfotransferase domain-containing protein n=2 Tax=Amphimedon queenslandica TaxID=400682 RepID=A0AAN0IPZ1_AMPQE|nr:PREDICTED: WSCD family member GA21586-like [Amphimedon queenslandica]|eukprot:XP_011405847.1 PREDICTED: WSCD family member GA21586-like [Amphimedon queenslandica]